jgi:hypothetical protein
MILKKNSIWFSRSTLRDVAVILRDVADADGGVDDHRPDRGDEDHEDRRGLLSRKAASESGSQASGGTVRSTWKIGSRPRIAQTDWPTSAPTSDADDRGKAEADGDALQRDQDAPAEPDILRAVPEERFDSGRMVAVFEMFAAVAMVCFLARAGMGRSSG